MQISLHLLGCWCRPRSVFVLNNNEADELIGRRVVYIYARARCVLASMVLSNGENVTLLSVAEFPPVLM